MAETSGPWDGSGFAQDEWRDLFSSVWYDGLLRDANVQTDGLTATLSPSNRDVTISPGKALIRGNLYRSDANIVINVPAPSGSNQRIDYIALRYDPSEIVLDDRITMVLIQGSEAANPSPPALTQDHNGIWEWPRLRIGPYGTGAISGAPSQFMGGDVTPVTFRSGTDPNIRLPGLPSIQDSLVIDALGQIWRYDVGTGQYNRLGLPQTGTIPAASGWEQYPGNVPTYRVTNDGLVTVRGLFRRTGSSRALSEGVGGEILFTGNLPSAIRPPSDTGLFFHQLAYHRRDHEGGPARYSGARVQIEGNPPRMEVMSAEMGATQWMRQNESWISIAGMTWWV